MTSAGRRARLWWLCGVGAAALLVLVVATQGTRGPSDLDLERREIALSRGCPSQSPPPPGSVLDGSAFLFEGVLEAVAPSRDGGALLEFAVGTWFVGPPLQRVDVRVDAPDLAALRRDEQVEPGSRLVVRGAGWSADGSVPTVGCDGVLGWDEALDRDLRAGNPTVAADSQDGPVALYAGGPWMRTAPLGAPVLTGVLLVQGGCLRVDNGDTRWLLRFPAEEAGWDQVLQSLRFDGQLLATGRTVRLAGSPASGLLPRRGQQLVAADSATDSADVAADDRATEPASDGACRSPGPVFVVAMPPERTTTEAVLPDDAPLVRALLDTAAGAGVSVRSARAMSRGDGFAGVSVVVELAPGAGSELGEVSVLLDTAPGRAWPDAYLDDETFRSSLGSPPCADGGTGFSPPTSTMGDILVQRDPGRTRLLLRAPGAPVVAVTAGPDVDEDGLCVLAALAATAAGT